jgi:putative transcriptional regulator
MSNVITSKVKRDDAGMAPEDWARLNALTDEEITERALSDPDAQPISDEQRAKGPRRPISKLVRHGLHMSYEAFAATYGIPMDTLIAWDRGTLEPTPAEVAYLKLIAREPEIAKQVVQPAAAE